LKVIISAAVVEASIHTQNVFKIHDLLVFARQENRHFLFFESIASIDLILETFSKALRPIYRELLEQSVRNALAFPSGRATIRIDNVPHSSWGLEVPILTLSDGIRVLSEKLVVLVENSTNDWNFLLGMMNTMDRKLIQEYVDMGWAEPMHGGGDTLGGLLDVRLKKPWTALRTFVLFDSDRLHPDEFNSEWTVERIGRRDVSCKAYYWEQKTKIHMPNRYWMLRRRFIESYMPKEELGIGAEGKTHADAVECFFGMRKNARWYFNMKDGFFKDSKRDDHERSSGLFHDVSQEVKEVLKNGFGGTLARHFSKSIEREFNWDDDAREEAKVALPKLLQLL
jgi:hypothetical protein